VRGRRWGCKCDWCSGKKYRETTVLCVVSGFRRGVNMVFTLLGFYAA